MKGLPRNDLECVAILCFIASVHGMIFYSIPVVDAQAGVITAADLLAQKEGELNLLVAVVENDSSNCDVLNGCSGKGNCSRLTCYLFGTPSDPNYQCLGVENNTFCDVACSQRNFDFSKSFIRRVDPVDNHIARTVCTQRFLDGYFVSSAVSNVSHFFRAFFGAVDGTMRTYPGADEACDTTYDPRVRPWYLESTYVPKAVTVLIDSGLNMRSPVQAGTTGETVISKAISTALRLLDTLTEGLDYVSFVCFDGTVIKKLNDPALYNATLMYQSFNDSLTQIVLNGSTSDPNATDTNNAINATIMQLENSNSIPINYLKVVIALIGGQQYRGLSDLDVSTIPYMNLFMYSFRTKPEPECNAAIRASLEAVADERLNNPLYALQSYYSFLAKLHINFMKNQTDYGPQYQDFSGIDDHTLTLSKAAFGPSGELLGVLGLDIFEKKVQEQYPTIQFQSIVEVAGEHDPGRLFDTHIDLQNTSVCFNHTDACPSLNASYVPGFLCDEGTSVDPNIGCLGCDGCTPLSTSPSTPHKKRIPGKYVAIIVTCGVVATVLVILVWKRKEILHRLGACGEIVFVVPAFEAPRETVSSNPGTSQVPQRDPPGNG